jgi:hypothetical protein
LPDRHIVGRKPRPPRIKELIYIAADAAATHMFLPGVVLEVLTDREHVAPTTVTADRLYERSETR